MRAAITGARIGVAFVGGGGVAISLRNRLRWIGRSERSVAGCRGLGGDGRSGRCAGGGASSIGCSLNAGDPAQGGDRLGDVVVHVRRVCGVHVG
eukprot:6204803-Pleurochrysis_carterae.AAC.1